MSKPLDLLGDTGTPGPWGMVTREEVSAVAEIIGGAQFGLRLWEIDKALHDRTGMPYHVSYYTAKKAVTILKRWGLIEFSHRRWQWVGGVAEERS